MGIEMPAEVRWLIPIVVGDSWPEGDETALQRLGEVWKQAATDVDEAMRQAEDAVKQATSHMDGDAAEAFKKYWEKFVKGEEATLPKMKDVSEKLATACRNCAMQIEYAKLSIIIALVVLAIQIAVMLASAVVSFGASTAGIVPAQLATRAAVQIVFRQLVQQLMQQVGRNLIGKLALQVGIEVATSVATDLAVQGIQLAKGTRDSLDTSMTLDAAKSGLISGVVGAGVGAGMGKAFGDGLGDSIGKSIGRNAAEEAIIGAGSALAEGALSEEGIKAENVLFGATSGAVSGSVSGTKAGIEGLNADIDVPTAGDMPTSRPDASPRTDAPPAPTAPSAPSTPLPSSSTSDAPPPPRAADAMNVSFAAPPVEQPAHRPATSDTAPASSAPPPPQGPAQSAPATAPQSAPAAPRSMPATTTSAPSSGFSPSTNPGSAGSGSPVGTGGPGPASTSSAPSAAAAPPGSSSSASTAPAPSSTGSSASGGPAPGNLAPSGTGGQPGNIGAGSPGSSGPALGGPAAGGGTPSAGPALGGHPPAGPAPSGTPSAGPHPGNHPPAGPTPSGTPAAGPHPGNHPPAGPTPSGTPAAGPHPGNHPPAGPTPSGTPAAGPHPGNHPPAGPTPSGTPAAGPHPGNHPPAGPTPSGTPAAGPHPGNHPPAGPVPGGGLPHGGPTPGGNGPGPHQSHLAQAGPSPQHVPATGPNTGPHPNSGPGLLSPNQAPLTHQQRPPSGDSVHQAGTATPYAPSRFDAPPNRGHHEPSQPYQPAHTPPHSNAPAPPQHQQAPPARRPDAPPPRQAPPAHMQAPPPRSTTHRPPDAVPGHRMPGQSSSPHHALPNRESTRDTVPARHDAVPQPHRTPPPAAQADVPPRRTPQEESARLRSPVKLPDRFAHLQDHAKHTPAGLSLHSRETLKMTVWGNAHRVAPDPHRYTVDLHGASDRAEVNGQRLSAKDVADIIRSTGDWDGKQPIRLLSCQTGTTKDGFAAQLAHELGVDVVAPTKDAWVDDDGNIFASSSHTSPNALTRIHAPGWPPNGEWVTFKPDGTNTRHNSSSPPDHVPTWGLDTPGQAPKSYRRNAGEPPWANDPHYLNNQQRHHGYGYHPPAAPGESFGPRGSGTNEPQPMVYAGRDPQGNPIYRPAYVPPAAAHNPPPPAPRQAPVQAPPQQHQHQQHQPRPSRGLPPGAVGMDLQGRPIDRQGRVLGPPMPVHQQMAPPQRHDLAPQQRRDVVHHQHQQPRRFDPPPVHRTPEHLTTQEAPRTKAPEKHSATIDFERHQKELALKRWADEHGFELAEAERLNRGKDLDANGDYPAPDKTQPAPRAADERPSRDPIERPTHMTTKDMIERELAMRAGLTKDTDYAGMQGYDFERGTRNLPPGLTLETPHEHVAQRYPHLAGSTFTYEGQPVIWRKPQSIKEMQSFRRDPLPGFNEDGSGEGLVARDPTSTVTELAGHIGGATWSPAKSTSKSPEHAISRTDGTIPKAGSKEGNKLVADGKVTVLPDGTRRMDVWISEIYEEHVIDVDATVRYYDGEKTSGHAEAEDLHLGVPPENIRRRWKQICLFDANGDLVHAHLADEPPVVNPRFKYAHLVQDDQ